MICGKRNVNNLFVVGLLVCVTVVCVVARVALVVTSVVALIFVALVVASVFSMSERYSFLDTIVTTFGLVVSRGACVVTCVVVPLVALGVVTVKIGRVTVDFCLVSLGSEKHKTC